jgi:2-polyprenyl-6-methoxyphenol hydroxylase-like FAD-dependent oxidoreductase
MQIVIIGGSVAGLAAGLLLSRAGHDVEVFDRDDVAAAADTETAAKAAFRPAAPQIVHLHGYHPAGIATLRERLPDVHAALLEAGPVPAPLSDRLPQTLTDRSDRPGDERFEVLLARRSTLDWVFRSVAAAEPGLRLTGRTPVTGLLARAGKPPTVVGVRTVRGERTAELVVDASGRRCVTDSWLKEIGARPPHTLFAECGSAYYSRHYRIRPGVRYPSPEHRFLLGQLPYFSVMMLAGDQNTRTITLAPLVEDASMRRLRDPKAHSAVARLVPPVAAWLEVLDPISGVHVMGGLHNTLRRLVVDDRPVALGLHAVGDAVCTTNPIGGRGIPLALRTAAELADVLAAHPHDQWAQAIAIDDAVAQNIAPWYVVQAGADSERLAAIRRALRDEPAPPLPDIANGVTLSHLRSAAMIDPELFRALSSVLTMLRTPAEVLDDAEVQSRVRAAFSADNIGHAPPGPSRTQILAAVEAAH